MFPRHRLAAILSFLLTVASACRGAAPGPPPPVAAPDSAALPTPRVALSRPAADTSALPGSLEIALASRDPLALADTSLPRLADLSEAERAALVAGLAKWPMPARIAAIAFLQVGTPYVLGPLGEEEAPDTDPLIQFRTTDCAVLVLVSEALAHAREAGGERNAMKLANYRDGKIGYASRLHFTTDRLDHSPYDRDITAEVAGDLARTRRVTLNRKPDGSRWIPIAWERERDVVYLPIADAGRLEEWHRAGRLPDAVGVALVQERRLAEGLDVVHETLLWKGQTLLHGSSRIGRVVTIPWSDFLKERGRLYDGVVIFGFE
jgi:hypothetical protein